MTKSKPFQTKDLVLMGAFVAVITICSWISVPLTIPFTLQTFAVFTTVALLGTRNGTLCVCTYVLLGALGIPVFSKFQGGLGALLGPTGGYIMGFIFSALVTGYLIDKLGRSKKALFFAMFMGLIVCYAFGTAWFVLVYTKTTEAISITTALSWCVIPYIVPDLAKITAALMLVKRMYPHISN
ncbi:MAG: biotin transporter BioY [Lachnospiraceae bacterium]|nr:biotin transporter BioY [Lachnospiraceae bacterium]